MTINNRRFTKLMVQIRICYRRHGMAESMQPSSAPTITRALDNAPWIEKYRPTKWADMIDHQEKIATLRRAIEKKELPHLLFHGAPGSGKTSLILATMREMYGNSYRQHVLELNASDHRGIEIVRTTIPEFTRVRSNYLRIVILDEADAMTADAQRALRRVMDNNISNCRIVLICNDITRIIPGIQSRCVKMRFGTLQPAEIKRRLTAIIAAEHVEITPAAIELLVAINSDFRQILNTLQCLHHVRMGTTTAIAASATLPTSTPSTPLPPYTPIDEAMVYEYLGRPSEKTVDAIFDLMFQDFNKAFQTITTLFRRNEWNLVDLLAAMVQKTIHTDRLNEAQRLQILKSLSEIEYRVVNGRDSELQLASLIASFRLVMVPS